MLSVRSPYFTLELTYTSPELRQSELFDPGSCVDVRRAVFGIGIHFLLGFSLLQLYHRCMLNVHSFKRADFPPLL